MIQEVIDAIETKQEFNIEAAKNQQQLLNILDILLSYSKQGYSDQIDKTKENSKCIVL